MLQKNHQSNDKMDAVEMQQRLQDVSTRAKENPQESFNQLEILKNECTNGLASLLSDNTHMSKIIGVRPEKCEGNVARVMQDK